MLKTRFACILNREWICKLVLPTVCIASLYWVSLSQIWLQVRTTASEESWMPLLPRTSRYMCIRDMKSIKMIKEPQFAQQSVPLRYRIVIYTLPRQRATNAHVRFQTMNKARLKMKHKHFGCYVKCINTNNPAGIFENPSHIKSYLLQTKPEPVTPCHFFLSSLQYIK